MSSPLLSVFLRVSQVMLAVRPLSLKSTSQSRFVFMTSTLSKGDLKEMGAVIMH